MSSDDVVGTGWGLDPGTQRALRLQSARDALARDDVELAVVELEEILDDSPTDVEALWSLAAACMVLRDHAVAREAWRALAELGVQRTPVFTQWALCAFEVADFDEAVTQARRALDIHADLPEAHYILALSLQHLKASDDDIQAAFEAAYQGSPLGFPMPLPWTPDDIEAAVNQALASLPPDVQALYEGVPFRIDTLPRRAELVTPTPPISPRVLALYEGVPPEALGTGAKPDAMRIYATNLAHHDAIDLAVAALADALMNEASDWMDAWDDAAP